jgi:hypothetical protein
MLPRINVYFVQFKVFRKSSDSWKRNISKSHSTHIVARDLNEIITKWPEVLLAGFEWESGTGGSHYSTDPVYGDSLEFVEITKVIGDAVAGLPE